MADTQQTDVETWRPVASLPEYIASSWGRVMRIPFVGPMPKGSTRPYGGFPHFGIWHEEERRYCFGFRGKTYKVARVVCEAFSGAPPFEGAVCMHIDENSRNNRPENLRWGTQKENLNFPGFLEYCRNRKRAA